MITTEFPRLANHLIAKYGDESPETCSETFELDPDIADGFRDGGARIARDAGLEQWQGEAVMVEMCLALQFASLAPSVDLSAKARGETRRRIGEIFHNSPDCDYKA